MIFKYKNGALTCDTFLQGFTDKEVSKSDTEYYGNKYFICESISKSHAEQIATLIYQHVTQAYTRCTFIVEN